jgi:streptogramin lyase
MKKGFPCCVFFYFLIFYLCFASGLNAKIHFEKISLAQGLSQSIVETIIQDKNGFIWIGTEDGLNRFDGYKFDVFKENQYKPGSLTHDNILALLEGRNGMIWVGTFYGGLNRFDPFTEKSIGYRFNADDKKSISSNVVRTLFEDKQGSLWIGTDNGLNKLNQVTGELMRYSQLDFNFEAPGLGEIFDICEDSMGNLLIATNGNGIISLNLQTEEFSTIDVAKENSGKEELNRIRCLLFDKSGILWIGTDGGGLVKWDRKKNRYTVFENKPDDPRSISNNMIRRIFQDSTGKLWIGTDGGLNIYDFKSNTFKSYINKPTDSSSLSHNEIHSIFEDRSGVIWIGTYGGGINKFSAKGKAFSHFYSDPSNKNSLSHNIVWAFHEDELGILWIGTEEGLNRFDPAKGAFSYLDKEDGLIDNTIYGILEDKSGKLWMSTNNGLSCFDKKTGVFKNYNKQDGLQSNEFNGGSFYKSQSGEMFFGGINGFNSFFPYEIQDNSFIPPIVITSFKLLNIELFSASAMLKKKEIGLSYKDYLFSIEFAALDFTSPNKNQYAFKLEGLDKDWIYTDSKNRKATYTTLAPGKYVFKVKGSNNDGVWNEEVASLIIRINPPFWLTWWFKLLVIITIIVCSWFLYSRKVKSVFIKTRMETEMKAAQNAQMSIMPQEKPEIPGFDIEGICIPSYEVGGDFFDYLWVDRESGRLGIVVGDVSGKAMKAAMTAVMSSGIVFSHAEETYSINKIMVKLNKTLRVKTKKHVFTALGIMTIDKKTLEVEIANAGLPEPVLLKSGKVSFVRAEGTRYPLGIRDVKKYPYFKTSLNKGDIVVMLSDGVLESWNSKSEFYGKERLKEILEKVIVNKRNYSAKEIIELILNDIREFSVGTLQHDDMTIVVVKIK